MLKGIPKYFWKGGGPWNETPGIPKKHLEYSIKNKIIVRRLVCIAL